jgi:energy-coupling factor transporter ATP-binding protein EcfA2
MSEPLVRAEGLSFWYPGAPGPALKDVDLQIHEGEVVGVIGPTGAAKSTLLHCLCGVIPWYERGTRDGAVTVLGKEIRSYHGLQELTRVINLMLQDPEAQLFNLHVVEELAWGLENLGIPAPEIRRRVDVAAALFGIEHLLSRVTYTLSGGEKQRVALAAVYALQPRIVLLDEPSSELDPVGTDMVFAAVRTLAAQGVTVVIVEHKIEYLVEHVTRLLLISDGRIVKDAGVRAFFAAEDFAAHGVWPPQVYDLGRSLEAAGVAIGEAPLTLADATTLGERLLGRTAG